MKTQNAPALSPFKIVWLEFFPDKGKVTVHDQKAFGSCPYLVHGKEKTYRKHFANKEHALQWLGTFKKRLDKAYTVRMFTDEQYGLAREADGYRIPYTKKQWAETWRIG